MTIHTMKKVSLVVMLFLLQKSFDVTRRLAVLGVLLFALAVSQTALAQQIVQGSTADGSLYEFVVPTIWNQNLVVYAHGIVDPQAPIQLPADNSDFARMRASCSITFSRACCRVTHFTPRRWISRRAARRSMRWREHCRQDSSLPARRPFNYSARHGCQRRIRRRSSSPGSPPSDSTCAL